VNKVTTLELVLAVSSGGLFGFAIGIVFTWNVVTKGEKEPQTREERELEGPPYPQWVIDEKLAECDFTDSTILAHPRK